MAYNSNGVVTLGQMKTMAETINGKLAPAIKSLSVSGNTISFFTSTDGSGTAAYTVDFPTEYFLDQTKTTFVNSFSWSATTYPGSTNPSLNGKPVLVMAIKGSDSSVTYSFLNMASLVDTYTSGNTKTLSISGKAITVRVSTVTNQAITIKDDGLHVDISGKADKVPSSTNGNLAGLDANGNLTNSGIAASTVTGYATTIAAKAAKLTGTNIKENNLLSMTSGGDLKNSGIAVSTVTGYGTTISSHTTSISNLQTAVNGKVATVTGAENNFVMFGKSNVIKDSGYTVATAADMTAMLTEVFG